MISPRLFLYPFSILYDGVTRLRNTAYDRGWLTSYTYDVPVICVGNLSVGGTGKSPMIEYLISILQADYKVGVVSRGYGRSTKGFREVTTQATPDLVGDEPLQIKINYPEAVVVVSEKRHIGITAIKNKVDVILLDDAFQHRSVTPSFTIALTAYPNLYYKDFVLPAGTLREARKGINRADVVVVTKSPPNMPYAAQQKIIFEMGLAPHQKIYFSSIGYASTIENTREELPISYLKDKEFSLVTGIANPTPLVKHLKEMGLTFTHHRYADHHHFTEKEIAFLAKEEIILTTQKDYMRLQHRMDKYALYYLPIVTEIKADKASFFEDRIKEEANRKNL